MAVEPYHVNIARSRISSAFSELRRRGWVARMNFSCCMGCGFSEIGDENENVVFFHRQDNEDLNEKAGCYLAWGGNAEELLFALTKQGLAVRWDGKKSTRIWTGIVPEKRNGRQTT